MNELTRSNSLTVERWRHRAIDTLISLSIPLVISFLLSTRTILRSTERLELATREDNTPLSYGLWGRQTKPNGTRAVKLMQLKCAFLGGFDITTKIKNRHHSEAYWKERNRLWRSLFPLVIQAVTLYKYLRYHAAIICYPNLRRKQYMEVVGRLHQVSYKSWMKCLTWGIRR